MSNELERLSDNLNALNEMHKITVDRKYNSSSENPQSGIAVAEAVESHIFDIAKEHDIPVIGRIPMEPKLAAACDAGMIELYEGNWLDVLTQRIEAL